MRIRKKFLAVASTVALAAGLGAVVAAPVAHAAAPPPIDVSNDRVQCNDVIGKVKFSVPLTLNGTTPNQVTISIKSDDCTDLDNANVSLKGGASKGILNAANNNCLGLQGLSTGTSGSLGVKWSVNTGTPKITNGGTPGASTFTISQTWGGTYNDGGQTSPAAASDSWGGEYGFFAIGGPTSGLPLGTTQSYTTNPSISGAFTGGDGGANSIFQGSTTQTTGALGVACLTVGIKGITFGIGGFTFK